MEIIDVVSQIMVALVSIGALVLTVSAFAVLLGQVVSRLFED
jgi:hypothetical protein